MTLEEKKTDQKIKNIEHRLKTLENKSLKAQAVAFDKLGDITARMEELEEAAEEVKELKERLEIWLKKEIIGLS